MSWYPSGSVPISNNHSTLHRVTTYVAKKRAQVIGDNSLPFSLGSEDSRRCYNDNYKAQSKLETWCLKLSFYSSKGSLLSPCEHVLLSLPCHHKEFPPIPIPTLNSQKPWACHPPTILIPTSPALFAFSLIYWFVEQMEKIHCKELFQFFKQKRVQLTNVFHFWYPVVLGIP